MIDFIKKIFLKKGQQPQQVSNKKEECSCEELKTLKAELDWFYSLGLPSHLQFEERFDYYNFLKSKIEELRLDKEYLVKENARKAKIIEHYIKLERLYLEKIAELENKLSMIKVEIELVKKRKTYGESNNELKTKDVETDKTKKLENHKKEELTPLQEVKRKIEELKKEGFKIYG